MSDDNESKLEALESTIEKLREKYRKQEALLQELEEYVSVCRAIGHDDLSQVERMYPGGRWQRASEHHRDTVVVLKDGTEHIIRGFMMSKYKRSLKERGVRVVPEPRYKRDRFGQVL